MIIVKKTILKGTKYQFGGNKKKYPTNAAKDGCSSTKVKQFTKHMGTKKKNSYFRSNGTDIDKYKTHQWLESAGLKIEWEVFIMA